MMTLDVGHGLVRQEGQAGVAYFSEDRIYRYALERRFGDGDRSILWIMLNPSVADHERNDLTIKKCIGFSKAWGSSALRVVNLFALIETDPRELFSGIDPEGALNSLVLRQAGRDCEKVVVAWGGLGKEMRMRSWNTRREIRELYAGKLHCLGRTGDSYPRHPSRIAYSTPLEAWL
jgi:hypothetical protein